MKVTLLEIGKTEADYLKKGIDIYLKRIAHYIPFNEQVIPSLKKSGSLSEAQQKQKEGDLILGLLNPTDELILLDEKGEQFSSVEFARLMEIVIWFLPLAGRMVSHAMFTHGHVLKFRFLK
jgi:23S rRNA (pseudouridine1915-N3)-methyltransferase